MKVVRKPKAMRKPKPKMVSTTLETLEVLLDEGLCRIVRADMLEYLDSLEPESFDACVTDPPYELGFMGKSWDTSGVSFRKETWEKILRVLKPGGHLVAFGGTRTVHRIGVAIEDAGFECRDLLVWHYGSGFPKSLNISKAIDKAAGATRVVIGVNPNYRANKGAHRNTIMQPMSPGEAEVRSIPATPEAALWDGWGTGLKPSTEPIILARKPISEKTIAANVLKHGTGAINVGVCRIGTEKRRLCGSKRQDRDGKIYGVFNGIPAKDVSGRWPANLLLSHSHECICVGTREAKGVQHGAGRVGFGAEREDGYVKGQGRSYTPDETTDLWACVPGCPIRMIDEQSGNKGSGRGAPTVSAGTKSGRGTWTSGGGSHRSGAVNVGVRDFGDSGGASRFFYCAKASTDERSLGLPLSRRNMHPTVKPIALMRWLVRLVTPPGGIVLDPFAGSGTTGVAAIAEGFRAVIVERDPDSASDCVLRVKVALRVGKDIDKTKRFKLKGNRLKVNRRKKGDRS